MGGKRQRDTATSRQKYTHGKIEPEVDITNRPVPRQSPAPRQTARHAGQGEPNTMSAPARYTNIWMTSVQMTADAPP